MITIFIKYLDITCIKSNQITSSLFLLILRVALILQANLFVLALDVFSSLKNLEIVADFDFHFALRRYFDFLSVLFFKKRFEQTYHLCQLFTIAPLSSRIFEQLNP